MKSIALIAIGVLLGACTMGQNARTSSTLYEPTNSSKVEILFEKPDRPYHIIGTARCKAHTFASDDAVIRSIQKEAAELGAHAVLFQGYGDARAWDGSPLKTGSGLAIRWKDSKKNEKPIAVTPTSTKPTTPKETQVIPKGSGVK